ncbi:DUF1579 domain-containing protein [Planctomicrobium sp. SH664]|uniref:DUF1579 domain-containing protein n=1 Tax=Planctomicrobium sp. SH664 TaxID=3448125 RepID=UPI003F5CAE10
MFSQPQQQHQWLQQLVGEWVVDMECSMGPDQPPGKFQYRESVRSLGGLWVMAESVNQTPDGGESRNIMTLGFDAKKQRYVGTFISSMMDYLWTYDGERDAATNTLPLAAEGPTMDGQGFTQFVDSITIIDKDHRTLKSKILMPDGNWVEFMSANYRRVG